MSRNRLNLHGRVALQSFMPRGGSWDDEKGQRGRDNGLRIVSHGAGGALGSQAAVHWC